MITPPDAEKLKSANRLYDVLTFSERLKRELRHSWLADGRQESVAEHCWQMAFMALLAAPLLDHKIDLTKALKMILVHDLVEAEVGDIPATEVSERQLQKHENERRAIQNIREKIGGETGTEIETLWREYEANLSPEARFSKALDKLEVQIQHNIAPLTTWEEKEYHMLFHRMDKYCEYDGFLRAMCEVVKIQGSKKLEDAGLDSGNANSKQREEKNATLEPVFK